MKDLIINSGPNRLKLRYLKWDSDFFGLDSYLLDAGDSNVSRPCDEFENIAKREMGRSFIAAKIPHAAGDLTALLFNLGFNYINTEITLRYDGQDISNESVITDTGRISLEKTDSLPEGVHDLGKEFAFSRFHSDKNIAKDKADLLWVSYIKNFRPSRDRHLFIAKYGAETIGSVFVCQEESNGKRISNLFLVSLKEQYRGKEIGSAMIRYAADWCARESDIVVVETMLNNLRAVNFYLKNGFSRIIDSKLILHRWEK